MEEVLVIVLDSKEHFNLTLYHVPRDSVHLSVDHFQAARSQLLSDFQRVVVVLYVARAHVPARRLKRLKLTFKLDYDDRRVDTDRSKIRNGSLTAPASI